MPLDAIAEKRGFEQIPLAASVLEYAFERLGSQVFQAAIEVLAEMRHADACNVDFAHVVVSETLRFTSAEQGDAMVARSTGTVDPRPAGRWPDRVGSPGLFSS